MSETTPMMKQYMEIKKKYKDSILFFRLGDFYEMFREDAKEVSRILNLTLTQRHGIPMCGIPYHAAENYLGRLIKAGKKVAICEQTAMPKGGKGIAKREVVEIITPGTVTQENYLEKTENNYLVSLGIHKNLFSFAYIDISTGEFRATSFEQSHGIENIKKEVERLQPKEILLQESLWESRDGIGILLKQRENLMVNRYPDWGFHYDTCQDRLEQHFGTLNLKAFGIDGDAPEVLAAGVLLEYVEDTSKAVLGHIGTLDLYDDRLHVGLDESTQKNLELVRNMQDGSKKFTLLSVLDNAKTAMGARLLRNWILNPLIKVDQIQQRQARVTYFYQNQILLSGLREELSKILDIERLSGRLAMEKAHGKDMLALLSSLSVLEKIEDKLHDYNDDAPFWTSKSQEVVKVRQLKDLLVRSIHPEPSILLSEGRLIKDGYSEELDELRSLKENSQQILKDYLEDQKEVSGITNLKLKYNKILGYFFEVTKSALGQVPTHFHKRQQLVNADRFTTDELSEMESKIHSASEKIIDLEKRLFLEIREKARQDLSLLLTISRQLAEVDVFQSLAHSATVRGYICPEVHEGRDIFIEEGRHGVVEVTLPPGEFVANSLKLDPDQKFFAMITGPNMAGKSTFLRQVALITLMAQMGSFVPARSARIGVVDKIFCRVGASDNLARGESTFLVEMNETAHILRNATPRSLIIMDEVGRGTSTKDGLSIAWAVCEYIIDSLKSKTLFATHYHELTLLPGKSIQNFSMDVRDTGGEIVFLKKIKKGPAGNSYGVHVAQLAGVPKDVVYRASKILDDLSKSKEEFVVPKADGSKQQGSLFDPLELLYKELVGIDINRMTPLDALNLLARWKKDAGLN